ncbi:hypothetical protein M1D34_31035 (plasmid) [Ensifer sp. D2-11]
MTDESNEPDLDVATREFGSVGGAAAIHGFVYQILASIGQLVRAQFGSQAGRVDSDTITAIFEPTAGGDLSIEADARKVIQFKHRNVPVSVGLVARKVLPDLFRAHCDNPAAAYELHTTNGVSGPGRELLATLKNFVAGTAQRTDARAREAFTILRDVFKAAKGTHDGFDDSFATFIDRVSIAPDIDTDQARREAIRFLETRVPYREDAASALDTLVGHLADQAKRNDVVISVDYLLSRLDLPSVRASSAATSRLADLVLNGLQARGFDPDFDVRSPISINDLDELTLVAGESGCGKSWVLYRLADKLARSGRQVVLVRAAERLELERHLQHAVGVKGLLQEKPLAANVLGQTWRRMHGDPEASIAILWEGCRDAAILDDLRLNGGLGPGLSLIAEFPVSQADRLADFDQVPTHRVTEFTPAQLFEALKKRGVSAGTVPREIRRMLRLPVLAGMYATLALELEQWDPRNEYRVLEGFWGRAQRHAGKFAGARLKSLARTLVASRRTSVTDDEALELGFSEQELETLVAAGWLSSLSGRWSFAHDRLLTWAIAMALASDFDSGALDATALAAQVGALQADRQKAQLSGLGFLLMDVVWLIAGTPRSAAAVVDFLEVFERDHWADGGTLYDQLLPTAGIRVLGVLEERARRVVLEEDRVLKHLASAFRVIPLDEHGREALIRRLWGSEDHPRRWIAISLGAQWPLLEQRDILWRRYCELSRERRTPRARFDLVDRTETALSTIVRAMPSCLMEFIDGEDGPDELQLAVRLMNKLDVAQGATVWASSRKKLLEAIPGDLQSILMECIRRYPSESDRDLLELRIVGGGGSSRSALEALAEIDARAALAIIRRYPPIEAVPHSRTWLDRLLDADRNQASDALRDWLIQIDPSGGELASVWRAAEDRIDEKTIDLLLDKLDDALDQPKSAASSELLGLLGSPTFDPVNDHVFWGRRSSPLAAALLDRIKSHLDGESDRDHSLASRLLRRIGGEEHELAVLHSLRFDDIDKAHPGIIASFTCSSDVVTARLAQLALGDAARDGNDDAVLDLWRSLIAKKPSEWHPRLRALLESEEERLVTLALKLITELPRPGDFELILGCIDRTAAGSPTEAGAMSAALKFGKLDERIVGRAIARIKDAGRGPLATEWVNVLLRDRSIAGRAALDAYLAPLETATSWNSLDSQALAIRLGQGDAAPGLWRAGARMMHRPSLSGENFIEAFLEHDREQALDVLLERTFAAPEIFTNAQPDAIRLLASVDRPLATQAFVQSWKDHPKRRTHLVKVAHLLDDEALEAMIASLGEERGSTGTRATYRAICVVMRSRRERARKLLLSRLLQASSDERGAMGDALGWVLEAADDMIALIDAEKDDQVRRQLYGTWRHWKRVESAVMQFRDTRTLASLEYAVDVADPEVLCMWQDPLRIVEPIREDDLLTTRAEKLLAMRYNALDGSKLRRVVVRKQPDDERGPG